MNHEPLANKVKRRLQVAAHQLGTVVPEPVDGLLSRTFVYPDGDQRYARNALLPEAAPFEPSFSEEQPGNLRFTIEPLPPEAASLDRRDEATREMRRLIRQFVGLEALRWFDGASEPHRGFSSGAIWNTGPSSDRPMTATGSIRRKCITSCRKGRAPSTVYRPGCSGSYRR